MNFSKLDSLMNKMPILGYPSCEIVISRDGKTIYQNSIGYADADKTRPASPNDLYWLFSCTKVITCIAALRLLESGDISLDDPVSKYLPEFKNPVVRQETGKPIPAKNVMTVRHLFTMTAGLSYDIDTPAIKKARTKDATTRSIIRAIAEDPIYFEPGTHYKYSLCHDVLGGIIETVSGMSLSEYMKRYIFDPLGLSDIGFHPSEEQAKRFVDMYEGNSGTNISKPIPCINNYIFSQRYDSGGAGLFSTASDYASIIATIANGGVTADGYTLLRPETIAMAQKNLLDYIALTDFCNGRLFGYGWGLCGRVHRDASVSFSKSPVGEFGWDSAGNALALIDPENRLSFIFLAHVRNYAYGYNYIHPILRNIIYECLEEK